MLEMNRSVEQESTLVEVRLYDYYGNGSNQIIEELGYVYDYKVQVPSATAERWRVVMKHYYEVQAEMEAAKGSGQHFFDTTEGQDNLAIENPEMTMIEGACAGHAHLHEPPFNDDILPH